MNICRHSYTITSAFLFSYQLAMSCLKCHLQLVYNKYLQMIVIFTRITFLRVKVGVINKNKSRNISAARRRSFPIGSSRKPHAHGFQSKYYSLKFTRHLLIFLSNRTQLLPLGFSLMCERQCKQTTHTA